MCTLCNLQPRKMVLFYIIQKMMFLSLLLLSQILGVPHRPLRRPGDATTVRNSKGSQAILLCTEPFPPRRAGGWPCGNGMSGPSTPPPLLAELRSTRECFPIKGPHDRLFWVCMLGQFCHGIKTRVTSGHFPTRGRYSPSATLKRPSPHDNGAQPPGVMGLAASLRYPLPSDANTLLPRHTGCHRGPWHHEAPRRVGSSPQAELPGHTSSPFPSHCFCLHDHREPQPPRAPLPLQECGRREGGFDLESD